MDLDTVVQRRQSLEFSRLDEAHLAIDAQAGFCYGLNTTGGIIWQMIGVPISVGEICTQLRREYAAEEETCRRDVIALLSGLQDAGLLQIISQPEKTTA